MAAKEPYEKLWTGAVKFHKYYDKWMNGPLLEVDAEEVEEEVLSPLIKEKFNFCADQLKDQFKVTNLVRLTLITILSIYS